MGTEEFVLDDAGNLRAKTVSGPQQPPPLRFTYLQGNQVISGNGTEYKYDGYGRIISKTSRSIAGKASRWAYEWDAENQLTAVLDPAGGRWEYIYDPFGRRIGKQGNGRKFRYVWQEGGILQVLSDGKPIEAWVNSPHDFSPLAKIRDGKVFSVITDALGTPRELVDTRGKVVWAAYLDAYGSLLESDVDCEECDIRLPGQWLDRESGLHYNVFRYYDPETGHFLCPDPVGLGGGLNEYLYSDNPTKWIDPYGLCEFPRKSLRGVSLKWLSKNKPKGWTRSPTRDNEGWIWTDKAGVERLRFMRPTGDNPSANQWSRQANGYFRWQNAQGEHLDINGNAIPQNHPQFNELTHIMYEGI